MNKHAVKMQILKEFITRADKLHVGHSTSDKFFGEVTLVKSAAMAGSRKYRLANSRAIKNGTYTIGGLRTKLAATID